MEDSSNSSLNGVLLVDKPCGISSFDVIRLLKLKLKLPKKFKIGHAGTLDPFAEGMLVILLGEATKISNYILHQDKTYEFIIKFGVYTDTYDSYGAIEKYYSNVNIDVDKIRDVLATFVGISLQIPPKFSAIKIKGEKAYNLARKGQDFSMPTREIKISLLEFIFFDRIKKELKLKAVVSKGTYIRSLALDIATKLESIAYVNYLRRPNVGNLKEKALILGNCLYNMSYLNIIDSVIPLESILDDVLEYPVSKLEESIKILNGVTSFIDVCYLESRVIYKVTYKQKLLSLICRYEDKINILRVFNHNANFIINK